MDIHSLRVSYNQVSQKIRICYLSIQKVQAVVDYCCETPFLQQQRPKSSSDTLITSSVCNLTQLCSLIEHH